MNCTDARDRLLEADPTDLRRESSTDLAAHLETCAACRTLAERILASEAALGAHLAAAVPEYPDPATVRTTRHGRRSWLRWVAAAVPALAAAGVALLLTTRGTPLPSGELAVGTGPTSLPLVDAAVGQAVAVIETDNPNIVIVWTF